MRLKGHDTTSQRATSNSWLENAHKKNVAWESNLDRFRIVRPSTVARPQKRSAQVLSCEPL